MDLACTTKTNRLRILQHLEFLNASTLLTGEACILLLLLLPSLSLSFSETLSQTLQSELEKLFEDGKEEGVEDESNEVVVGLAFAKFDQAVREKFYLQDRDEEIRNAFKAFDTQGKISAVL